MLKENNQIEDYFLGRRPISSCLYKGCICHIHTHIHVLCLLHFSTYSLFFIRSAYLCVLNKYVYRVVSSVLRGLDSSLLLTSDLVMGFRVFSNVDEFVVEDENFNGEI